jgi:tetratricopeptide (TPR) repeat protein
MGVVYRARQIALNRDVALKMILAGGSASPQAMARFQGEAQAVAQLVHPNIVQVYEVGDVDGLPYFSLEFVPGGTLAGKVAKEPQDPVFAARTVEVLARAMHYAHGKNIVHRDLKPANVLLAPDGTPKITDFGLAKRLEAESGQTNSGAILGTPSYMAPEQAIGANETVGPAADTYALGAMLYDLLTGRPPFAGTSLLDTLEMVRTREPAAPSQLVAKIPKDLETICLKCLQKDSAKRYPSAEALADDLRNYLEGRPIVARPISPPERAWRWAKRNPWVAGLGSSVAALLLTVAVVSSVLSYRLSIRTKEAVENYNTAETERIAAVKAREEETIAKNKEAKAREEETKARGVTAEQRRLALDAIRKVVIRIDDRMRRTPELFAMREDIIKLALEEVDKIRDHANANPLAGRVEAISYQKMADLYVQMNKIQDALKQYDRSQALYEQMYAADPNNPINIINLAGNTNFRGEQLRRLGDTRKALEEFQKALKLRQRWQTIDARDEPKLAVARSHEYVGMTYLALGEPSLAKPHLAAQVNAMPGIKPIQGITQIGLDRELFMARKALGEACLRNGDTEEGLSHLKAAHDGLVILSETYKSNAQLLRDAAFMRMHLGDALMMLNKDYQAAAVEYQKAYDSLKRIWNLDKTAFGSRRDLASALYRQGVMATLSAQPDAAKKFYEECLTYRDVLAKIDPKDTQSRIERMLISGRLNKQTDAETDARELLKQSPDDPRIQFSAACGFSLASQGPDAATGARCLDQSLAALEKLIAGGWKDRWILEHDPDLEDVRKSPKFAGLVAKIVTNSGGKK